MPDGVSVDASVREYVSDYVWGCANDPGRRNEILNALEQGSPFTAEDDMAVAMIDISGYSALTADLSTIGKAASEIITNKVNLFLKQ
ncbi:hypothetical protein HDV05_002375, partial [Chytridiales sp. JEL 0842]